MRKTTTYLAFFFTIFLLIKTQDSFSQFYGWTPLGNGINNGTSGTVNAIAKYNNNVVVGGKFSSAGTVSVYNIASWNGTAWSSIGTGVDDTIFALTVFNGDLIAGGKFQNAGGAPAGGIAKWNGSTWQPIGTGFNGRINSLAVYNGKLIAAGKFTSYGNNIASWNGSSWTSLGSGINDSVYTLAVIGSSLYAGGKFSIAGGSPANNIAVWNNTAWSSLSTGVNSAVNSIAPYGGYIVAGGRFTQAGTSSVQYIAQWNGGGWAGFSFQLDSWVSSVVYYNSSLIVSGNFVNVSSGPGSLFVNHICKWDFTGCTRMITGTNQKVNFLYMADTSLYAGGNFTTAGGDISKFVSVWSNLTTHTISGNVRYSDNNQLLTSGTVKAVRLDINTKEVIVIDSALIQPNGLYQIQHGRGDSTYIVAFPNDEIADNFGPTYYPSSLSWQTASKIYPVGNLSNINLIVYRITPNPSTFNIGGHVYLNFMPPYSQPGFPFSKDAIVYAKQGSIYRKFAVSDSTEKYTLRNLSPGVYDLFVDRLGFKTASRTVTLGVSNIDTIDFYLDTVNVIGIQSISSAVPENFSLMQNFPNPFNPVTRFEFRIAKSGFVKLAIFDILGREVSTLVNEELNPGTYRASFDGSNFVSGVYFYTLETADFRETKKMVLIK